MRELPEYQVLAKCLHDALKGKKLLDFKVYDCKRLEEVRVAAQPWLVGNVIQSVYRYGKELHLQFINQVVLGIDLMLHGSLQLFQLENKPKFTIAELNFNGAKGLALTDRRATAVIKINPEKNKGVDALSSEVYSHLLAVLETRTQIKKLLINQEIIRGIGNVYADEILWTAGISPFSRSSAIPQFKIKALANSINAVLLNAERHIIDKKPSLFTSEVHNFLSIFGKEGAGSPTGAIIKVDKKGHSSTYYTDEQIVYK